MLFEFDALTDQQAKIKVIGVGGAGGNAINRMIASGLNGVEFVAINTDAQDLENNKAEIKIQIGKNLTKGLGAGAKADIGRAAIESEKESVANILEGADYRWLGRRHRNRGISCSRSDCQRTECSHRWSGDKTVQL